MLQCIALCYSVLLCRNSHRALTESEHARARDTSCSSETLFAMCWLGAVGRLGTEKATVLVGVGEWVYVCVLA